MGIIKKLREKSYRVELKKAEKKKDKLRQEAKKIAKLNEMKARLNRARGVKGLSNSEKALLKKKVDRIEARKKAIKTNIKIISKAIGKGIITFLQTVDEALIENKPRRRKSKRRK